jgi:hypothetical protein
MAKIQFNKKENGISSAVSITKSTPWMKRGPCAQIVFGAQAVLSPHHWPKPAKSSVNLR